MAQDNANSDAPLSGYFTKSDAARALGVTVRTLDRWALLRQGPRRTKLGQRVLYRKGAIIEWLAVLEEPTAKAGRR